MINRRNFLKASAASTFAGVGALNVSQRSASAAVTPGANDFKTIVCVFLDGGNDSYNMLMPNTIAEYNAYAQSRQAIALERSLLQTISPKGLGANSFGLHPNMPELKNMFEDGDASLIANIGPLVEPTSKADITNGSAALPNGLGGHNTGSSYWMADHDNSVNTSQDGIGGRLASEFVNLSDLPMSISAGAGYDLFLDHAVQRVYGVAPGGLVKMRDYDVSSGLFSRTAAATRRAALAQLNQLGIEDENVFAQHSGQLLSDGLELSITAQEFLNDVPPLDTEFPATPLINLSQNLERAAEMISIREQLDMRRQIIFVRASGFDRHDRLNIWHNPAMAELSAGLAAFNQAMKELDVHSSVLTYTASEFGRTLTNTGDGTDHAWGGNQILMGGGIKGGELFGSYPALELDGSEDYNGDGRMIPSTSVTQHAATIAKWFGVPQDRLSAVVPNISNFLTEPDLGFFA